MISIPNPCSEDFSKMAPTERGAYCEVCSVDTYDFTQLSDSHIYEILDENKGKHICGRFTKGQLASLNAPAYYAWKNQSARTFQSKFLLACVLVFGLTLFSCEKDQQATLKEVNIEQVVRAVEPNIGFINHSVEPEILSADLLDYVEPAPVFECDLITSGDIMVDYEQPVDYDVNLDYNPHVLGGAVVSEIFMHNDIQSVNNPENTLPDPVYNDPNAFEARVYPNPTQNMTTLSMEIESEGQFEITMFNMTGQMVTSIYSGHLNTGRQTFDVNLHDLNSGMYIIKVISQGQDETLKIQKVN